MNKLFLINGKPAITVSDVYFSASDDERTKVLEDLMPFVESQALLLLAKAIANPFGE